MYDDFAIVFTRDEIEGIRSWWEHPSGAQMRIGGDESHNYAYAVRAIDKICEFSHKIMDRHLYEAIERAAHDAEEEYDFDASEFVKSLKIQGYTISKSDI